MNNNIVTFEYRVMVTAFTILAMFMIIVTGIAWQQLIRNSTIIDTLVNNLNVFFISFLVGKPFSDIGFEAAILKNLNSKRPSPVPLEGLTV